MANKETTTNTSNAEYYVIRVKQGLLRGVKKESWYSGFPYYSFLGIPYAKPPIENLRFKPPEPYPKWNGVFDATVEKSSCLQQNPFSNTFFGSEDCLYMNVHTSQLPPKEKQLLPVMVMIHGGGHYFGSGNIDCGGSPDFVIHQGIVYVTFNYRLHVFGFLNLGLPQCPGNVGLKDIILVFRWVRDNIRNFGGDPNNVTAVGSSSSASLVHFLLLSPNVNGLFDKAILLGGYAVNPVMTYEPDGIAVAFTYGKILNYNGSSAKTLLNILKEKTATELLDAVAKLAAFDQKRFAGCYSPRSPLLPSIEIIKEGAVLPVAPRDLLDKVECIPVITGICNKEGMFIFMGQPIPILQKSLKSVIRKLCWMHEVDNETLRQITDIVRKFYFNGQDVSSVNLSTVMDFYTDAFYAEYYETTMNQLLRKCPSLPIYIYQFEYDGELNFLKKFEEKYFDTPVKGACHNDEFFYWGALKKEVPAEDRKIVDMLVKLWSNFAKYGNPNDECFQFKWKPSTLENPCFLRINENPELVNSQLLGEGLVLWQNIIKLIKEKNKMKKVKRS